jgi:transglutaminase-like putative cysteine protease
VRCFLFRLILICAGTILIAALHADPAFPAANVVIVTGIAGDAETEANYEATLGSLISTMAAKPGPPRIILFSDLKFPLAGLKVETRPPTREAFLALKTELAGQPLTAFMWGHAGKMGSKPVFHIRGPRLQPEDLRTLADAAGPGSQWILSFPGSGLFAQVLCAENRQILTTENESTFETDPVSMSLLPPLLTDAKTFEELGDTLAGAVSKYYESRQLVRREEPTLWSGTTAPLALATRAKAPSSPPAPAAAEWTQTPKVQAADFPGADGVVLWRKMSYVLGEATAVRQVHEEVIQVLQPEGKRLGDFDIQFSPPGENLEFTACEVLSPDGKQTVLPPDAIREVSGRALGDYSGPSRKIFSLPGVVPGALLHLRYEHSWKDFPLPKVTLEIPLTSSVPVLSSEIEVRLAGKSPFHFAFRGLAGPDPKIETTAYSQIYRWTLPKVAAARPEPLSDPSEDPALLLTTFADWKEFSGWYQRLIRLADTSTPEIEAMAKELTEHLKTDMEKAVALYNFVTSLRYVAVPLGVNSHRPHSAASVLANRYGDCKDKANLFNTMLRCVGVEADLVLVPRFTQALPEIPGLAFNHAISRVSIAGKTYWADTTDDVSRFGLLPPGDPGRNVLVIDPKVDSVTPLPVGVPADHRLVVRQNVDLEKGGATNWELSTTGFFDYQGRQAARAVQTDRPAFPVVGELLHLHRGNFQLEEQNSTAVAKLEEPFVWRGSGRLRGLLSALPGAQGQIVSAPIALPAEWAQAGQKRTRPLYLNSGYPAEIEQTITLQLPAKFQAGELPATTGRTDGPLIWQIEWKRAGENRLEIHCRISWPKGALTLAETEAFQAELIRLRAAAEVPVLLKPF